MPRHRMVPQDAEEARHIAKLMTDDNAAKLPELSKDLKLLRKRLEWAERWEGIASDLTEEEIIDVADIEGAPKPATTPTLPRTPRAATPKAATDTKPAAETPKA